MPEGEDHIFRIRAFILPEAGFKVTVSHIDALAEGKGILSAHVGIIAEGRGGIGGACFQRNRPGVRSSAGRIDLTGENLRKFMISLRTRGTDPDHGFNAVIFGNETKLYCAAGADHQNNMIKITADSVDHLFPDGALLHRMIAGEGGFFPFFRERREHKQCLRGIILRFLHNRFLRHVPVIF